MPAPAGVLSRLSSASERPVMPYGLTYDHRVVEGAHDLHSLIVNPRFENHWCRGWDSNPHASRPRSLSPLRLPFRHPGPNLPG